MDNYPSDGIALPPIIPENTEYDPFTREDTEYVEAV